MELICFAEYNPERDGQVCIGAYRNDEADTAYYQPYPGRILKGGIRMDPRLKHIVDHYDTFKIGLDEPFPFHCVQCGKCCVHREDILLNPQDLL